MRYLIYLAVLLFLGIVSFFAYKTNPYNLIFIGVFVAGIFIVAFLGRNNYLSKLEPMANEKILFEEKGVLVQQKGLTKRSTNFTNCIVRTTNHRIIVAQKELGTNNYQIRHIMYYMKELDVSLKQVRLNFSIKSSDVSTDGEEVKIDLPDSSMMTKGQFLRFSSAHPEKYMALFGK